MQELLKILKVAFFFWLSCFLLGFGIGKLFNSNPDKKTMTTRDKVEGVVALMPQFGIEAVAIKPTFEAVLKNGNSLVTIAVTLSGIGIGYGGYCLGSGKSKEDSIPQPAFISAHLTIIPKGVVVVDTNGLALNGFKMEK